MSGITQFLKNALALGFTQVRKDASDNTLLLTANGVRLLPSANNKPKIAVVTDSMFYNNDTLGSVVTSAPALPSAVIDMRVDPSVAPGDNTLEIDQVAGTARFKTAGNTYGATIDISGGGRQKVYDSAGYWADLLLLRRFYTGLGATEYVTTTSAVIWRTGQGAVLQVIESLYPDRFDFVRLSIGGSNADDVYAQRALVAAAAPECVLDHYGTNDIVAVGTAPADYVAKRVANWNYWKSLGAVVVAGLISPRWGSGGTDGGYTAAKRDAINLANQLLIAEASRTKNVLIVDTWSEAVDQGSTSSAVKTGWTIDGLHPGGALADFFARGYGAAFDSLFPARGGVRALVGSGGNYDAATNPYGNLMASGQGSFSGSGGTANTGVSLAAAWAASTAYVAGQVVISGGSAYLARVGGTSGTVAPTHKSGSNTDGLMMWECISTGTVTSAIAATWQWVRSSGAALLAQAYKEIDAQGTWQCFALYGAAVANEAIRGYAGYPTPGNITAGEMVKLSAEFDVKGYGCTGLLVDMPLTGTPASSFFGNWSLSNVLQSITGKRTVQMEPLKWPPSVTALIPRIVIETGAGAVCVVRIRSLALAKVAP